MDRITEKNLQAVVTRINRMTGSPEAAWSEKPASTERGYCHVSNIGNFHLDHAYGGVALHRMVNSAGGCTDVLRSGHVTKRDLYIAMFAFIEGLQIGQEMQARADSIAA